MPSTLSALAEQPLTKGEAPLFPPTESGKETCPDAVRPDSATIRGCKANHAYACYLAAYCLQAQVDRRPVGRLPRAERRRRIEEARQLDERAMLLARTGCDLGDTNACGVLAVSYDRGYGVEVDVALAEKLYRRACDNHYGAACFGLGEQLQKKGVLVDALQHYRAACETGWVAACAKLGAIYRSGDGVPKNEVVARRFLERACKLGERSSCRGLE